MVSGIYKITNLVNGKVYIGQSKDVLRRFKEHFSLGCNVSNQHLRYSMKHYGIENFTFEILLKTYDLDYWERFFIYWYQACDSEYGYNLTTGGQKNSERRDGFIYTDEMKKKMSEAAKRNWSDKDYHDRIVASQNKGKMSDIVRKRRSEATKRMWETGKFKDQPAKISKWSRGRKMSESMKLKMKEVSKIREAKHHLDYEIYLSNGGQFNYNEFCKHYKNGINDLLENL